MKSVFENVKRGYVSVGQYLGAFSTAPTKQQGQLALFGLGVLLIVGAIAPEIMAQEELNTKYNDARVVNSVNAILTYLEGSFGALIMVVAGLGAIMSAAFGQYKAALGCLVVAVGAFILRSFLSTFFNDTAIRG